MRFVTTQRHGETYRYLLRGDSEGFVKVWKIPEISAKDLQAIQLSKPPQPIQMNASLTTSLIAAWASMHPSPVGILDQIEKQDLHRKYHIKK